MKVLAEVDEQAYGLLCKPDEVEPLLKALREAYSIIWCEACYDPVNEATQRICQRLLPLIQHANAILRFKK